MLASLGLVALILLGAAIRYEVRSALIGITLSNGVEVLVSREAYREIVRRFQTRDEPDDWARWDEAVLETLRPVRPQEWRYLVRSLGYQVASEGLGSRRQRQTVNL
jgi:hypothetical protein